MKDTVDKILREEGIEYYSFLEYSSCREINPSLRERAEIEPRTVVLYLLPYFTAEGQNVSSYAVGIDYHLVIKRINSVLSDVLKKEYPKNKFLSFGDHSPIDERHAALISGLGMLGDNGLLINEKYGSYAFIGEIVTDLAIPEADLTRIKEPKRCAGCCKCKQACPTGILRGEGADCLSAITQKKGELTETDILLMKEYNTAWGCDVCQRVCPYNESPTPTPVEDFYEDNTPYLTKARLDDMDKETFSKRA